MTPVKCLIGGLLSLFATQLLYAQSETLVTPKTEAFHKPLNGVVEKKILEERKVLPYPNLREADLFWEKMIWRTIDVREKINLPFTYPKQPFFSILLDAAQKGEIKAYTTEDDEFSFPLEVNDIETISSSTDTITIIDPDNFESYTKVIKNDIDPADVKQFRVKELWYFDEATSQLSVRILGIAPLLDQFDEAGNYRYTLPLFWLYYPDCREVLSRFQVFNTGNGTSPISWEDYLEMRQFSSYITKESNVYDRRVEDYLTGVDMLLESEKIRMDIFNFEQDLWTY